MKRILLFGAGKSASVLIAYLVKQVQQQDWHLTVVDASFAVVQQKLQDAPNTTAASFDIADAAQRLSFISEADLVISLLPPGLHILVAKDCLAAQKNLLTASYVDPDLKKLQPEVEAAGLLFLCEMGLDPGLDHMSAKAMIDDIHGQGGKITSFLSHCGGLVAPESDDNPWHYKISWNPRNVVLAGKAGAVYKWAGAEKRLEYAELFSEKRYTDILGQEPLCWYPNRDSLSYLQLYNLPDCNTFVRTTLRHPDFMYGWRNIIDLHLTDENIQYHAGGKTLKTLFKEHLDRHQFNHWLEQRLQEQFAHTKNLLSELMNLTQLEQAAEAKGIQPIDEFMLVDEAGGLKEVALDDLKLDAATAVADRMHDASLTLKQLFYLGLDDDESMIDKDLCTAADILQYALEKKLALREHDKDLVVMKHEIEFERNAAAYRHTSTLVVKGEDSVQTAMAKTVGLPLGMAAVLILKGVIRSNGLQIPVSKEIYEPVLAELARHGIQFTEVKEQLL